MNGDDILIFEHRTQEYYREEVYRQLVRAELEKSKQRLLTPIRNA